MKELEVIATIGLPASGKSTWAKEQARKRENWVRVSRDDFRLMLKNAPTTDRKIEDMITRMQNEAIVAALRFGQNVIVDNTHVKAKYLEALADTVKFHADLNFMLFDLPAKKCIERDSGNVIRILTGRPDLSLEFWQRLKDTCDRAIDFLESRDENKDSE